MIKNDYLLEEFLDENLYIDVNNNQKNKLKKNLKKDLEKNNQIISEYEPDLLLEVRKDKKNVKFVNLSIEIPYTYINNNKKNKNFVIDLDINKEIFLLIAKELEK